MQKYKCVILAGGRGTRLQELTHEVPKPLLEVNGLPLIVHIMDIFASQGLRDFVVLSGYKGFMIKDFFANMHRRISDLHIDLETGQITLISSGMPRPYRVSIIDTGEDTPTGGRLLKARQHLEKEERFFLTYGDGLANVRLQNIVHKHEVSTSIATVTGVKPPGRFGAISHKDGLVMSFEEKPRGDGHLINGGFFLFNQGIFDYLDENSILEQGPLQKLTREKKLSVHQHEGYWQCVDTLRDLIELNTLASGKEIPPWLEDF